MRRQILVVKDVGEDAEILKDKLIAKGFSVLTAQVESEFWEHMDGAHIDLVIFDVCLEKRLSPNVYQVLLDLTESQKVPVILTAGIKSNAGKVLALSDKNYTFFSEPVRFEQLNAEIQKLLSQRILVSAA